MEGERKRSSLCISDRRTGPNPTFIFPQSFELCNDTSSSIVPPFFSRPSPLSSDKMSAAKQDGALAEARHWFAQNKLKAVGKEGRKEKQQRFECRRASDIASRRPRGESQRPPPTSPLSLFRPPPPQPPHRSSSSKSPQPPHRSSSSKSPPTSRDLLGLVCRGRPRLPVVEADPHKPQDHPRPRRRAGPDARRARSGGGRRLLRAQGRAREGRREAGGRREEGAEGSRRGKVKNSGSTECGCGKRGATFTARRVFFFRPFAS